MPSVHMQILTAAKNLVAAITGLTTDNQVVIRKRLAYVKQADAAILQASLPFVCLAPATEYLTDSAMPNKDLMAFPVLVAVALESGFSLVNPDTILLLREQIRQKLRTPLLVGVSEVFGCIEYDPSPPFSSEGFDASFDLSVQSFTWRTIGTRNQ